MMNYEKIKKMVEEIGIPASYHHFDVENAINPPFICWIIPGSDNFSADGMVFFRIDALNIELYTDQKDLEKEKQVENVLDKYGLFWEKTEIYIESENMYETLYELEV